MESDCLLDFVISRNGAIDSGVYLSGLPLNKNLYKQISIRVLSQLGLTEHLTVNLYEDFL